MDYETLRQRHLLDMRSRIPALVQRFDWPAERLKADREVRLRKLVAHAKAHSAWYGKHLVDVNAQTLTEETLADVPPMSKADLMEHFDAISTDPRITRDASESHLRNLESDAYLFERYHVCASGGSTGLRGVCVWDWEAWADGWAMFLAHLVRLRAREPDAAPASSPMIGAGVCAQDPMHMSSALQRSFSDPHTMLMHSLPVTQPFEQIVARHRNRLSIHAPSPRNGTAKRQRTHCTKSRRICVGAAAPGDPRRHRYRLESAHPELLGHDRGHDHGYVLRPWAGDASERRSTHH
jgi:hypothetical protein